jgi:hypothetical protein
VRVYAKQAGDYDLQNQACEIRIRAERRAGDEENAEGTEMAGDEVSETTAGHLTNHVRVLDHNSVPNTADADSI